MNSYLQKPIKLGRPTKYSDSAIKITRDYLTWCSDNDQCPFAEELALKLGIDDSTLWHWSKQHEEFRESYDMLLTFQKLILKQKALNGEYVGRIASLLLSSDHNMSLKRKVQLDAKISEEREDNLTFEQRNMLSEAITKVYKEFYSRVK